jgi:HAD superfamily hydrolase (TIGR01509 family)
MKRQRVRELNQRQGLRPGVEKYLRDARRLGLRVGIASSSDSTWVRGHLERLGVVGCFSCITCAEHTNAHKPDPAPYLAALRNLDARPEEAIAFEDSPNGIAAATAAGIFCVAVPNPVTCNLNLAAADLCVESLAAMPLEELIAHVQERRV